MTREQAIVRRAMERLQPETRSKLAVAWESLPVPLAPVPGESVYSAWYTLELFCTSAGVDPREVLETLIEAIRESE